mgnify:CR=1 FL=1
MHRRPGILPFLIDGICSLKVWSVPINEQGRFSIVLLALMLLLPRPEGEWPRIAVSRPHADFLGWRSDTAPLSPDSSLVYFSVLYGPSMEYLVTPSGI